MSLSSYHHHRRQRRQQQNFSICCRQSKLFYFFNFCNDLLAISSPPLAPHHLECWEWRPRVVNCHHGCLKYAIFLLPLSFPLLTHNYPCRMSMGGRSPANDVSSNHFGWFFQVSWWRGHRSLVFHPTQFLDARILFSSPTTCFWLNHLPVFHATSPCAITNASFCSVIHLTYQIEY